MGRVLVNSIWKVFRNLGTLDDFIELPFHFLDAPACRLCRQTAQIHFQVCSAWVETEAGVIALWLPSQRPEGHLLLFVDPSATKQQSENARPGQQVPLSPVPFCEPGEYRAVQYRHQHVSASVHCSWRFLLATASHWDDFEWWWV